MTVPNKEGWWWRAARGLLRGRPVDVRFNVRDDGHVFHIAWYDENNGWRPVTDDGYWRGPVLTPDEAALLDSTTADLHVARVIVGEMAVVQGTLKARIARLERVLTVEGGGEGAPEGWHGYPNGEAWEYGEGLRGAGWQCDGPRVWRLHAGCWRWRIGRGPIHEASTALEAMEAADVARKALKEGMHEP